MPPDWKGEQPQGWIVDECDEDGCITLKEYRPRRDRKVNPHVDRILRENLSPWDYQQVVDARDDDDDYEGPAQEIHIPAHEAKRIAKELIEMAERMELDDAH